MKSRIGIINNFMLVVFISGLFFYCYELIFFFFKSDQYKFGSEVAGWRYHSNLHYFWSLIIESFLLCTGVFSGLILTKSNHLLALRIGVLLLLIVIIIMA